MPNSSAPNSSAPHVHRLGPEAARDLSREVLLTDGLGGFALCSPAGVPTRRYSGLSVAHRPPGERRVMFVSALETLRVGEQMCELHAFEVAPGTTEGQGLSVLCGVRLCDLLPEREQQVLGLRIRRRSVMPRHSGALVLLYDIEAPHLRIGDEASLTLGGLFVDRDMHEVQRNPAELTFERAGNTVHVRGKAHQTRLYLRADTGAEITPLSIRAQPQRLHYRFEAQRGEADTDRATRADLWSIELLPGLNRVALVIEGLETHIEDPWAAYDQEAERRAELVSRAYAASGVRDEVVATLSVAADAFLVRRQSTQSPSVIAGYPWFADWGRDSMIALRGLTLLTGRLEEGLGVLDTFLNSLRGGLIANNFSDDATGADGTGASYNTVDGSLWLATTLEKLVEASGNPALTRMALGAVRGILGEYARGTAHGIGMDNADGLLSAGQAGTQLTWMDTKIHDWVLTPRHGKPVEIQALWLAALGAELRLSHLAGEESEFSGVLHSARQSFGQFWNPATNYLHDLLAPDHSQNYSQSSRPESSLYRQGPHTAPPNSQIRPNALIALALPDTPASPGQVGAALSVAARDLLTPLGLRTLAPSDPDYRPDYGGHRLTRDAAYHQGTVWPWLIGAYSELSVQQGQVSEARAALSGLVGHLWEAGLGSVSEVASAGSLTPGGCPFQAWSVAEVLRAHVMVSLAERAQVQASQAAVRAQSRPRGEIQKPARKQPVSAGGVTKSKGKTAGAQPVPKPGPTTEPKSARPPSAPASLSPLPLAELPQLPKAERARSEPPALPLFTRPLSTLPLSHLPLSQRPLSTLPPSKLPLPTRPPTPLPQPEQPPAPGPAPVYGAAQGYERGPAAGRLPRLGSLNLPPSTLGDIGSSTLGPADLTTGSGLMGLALMPGPLPVTLPQSPHLPGRIEQAEPKPLPELDEPMSVEDPDVIEPLT
ncbi:amylo-alpha-1,6-glucosidase [Deinococcus sp.]|uniref:amylo-alpha-1,6-glucosidase n=1 Tax=Deinococcus sp. TaxID=47478 RepID=UPI0025ED0DF8|nr:amylo-alpha-1,6-glucosidase [Deinococcus sp.]